jgi:hypothetical protein
MQVFGMTHDVTADLINDQPGVICRRGLNRRRMESRWIEQQLLGL